MSESYKQVIVTILTYAGVEVVCFFIALGLFLIFKVTEYDEIIMILIPTFRLAPILYYFLRWWVILSPVIVILVLIAGFNLGEIYVSIKGLAKALKTRFSVSGRARRASERGEIDAALRLYAGAHDISGIRETLSRLPNLPIRKLLIEAAEEVLELEKNAVNARKKAVIPRAEAESLVKRTQQATDALWERARRMAALSPKTLNSTEVRALLAQDSQILQRLVQSATQSQTALTMLILKGGSREALEDAEIDLRTFGEVVGELLSTA